MGNDHICMLILALPKTSFTSNVKHLAASTMCDGSKRTLRSICHAALTRQRAQSCSCFLCDFAENPYLLDAASKFMGLISFKKIPPRQGNKVSANCKQVETSQNEIKSPQLLQPQLLLLVLTTLSVADSLLAWSIQVD